MIGRDDSIPRASEPLELSLLKSTNAEQGDVRETTRTDSVGPVESKKLAEKKN